jgi:hypothetical protein
MRVYRVAPIALIMFLTLGVASVFASGSANGYGTPKIGTNFFACLGCGVNGIMAVSFSALYPNGAPAWLGSNHANLKLCTSWCVSISVTVWQISPEPGYYGCSFVMPKSLTGTVTIYVTAGSLSDDFGRMFPSVDTPIGTYAYSP